MIKDLTPREKAVLSRLCIRKIVSLLDERDFGRYQIPGIAYARPHLGLSCSQLFDKFFAKLSPTQQTWYNNNCECVILSRNPNLLDTELPYWQAKVAEAKKNNGGHVLNVGRQTKPTTKSTKQSSGTEPKNPTSR